MIYKNENLNSLARILDAIEDPRGSKGKLHRLTDILVLSIYGVLWGHTDFVNMARDLRYSEDFFTRLLGLKNGVPSHDTFSAVFSIIDPAEFLECFITWIVGIANAGGKHVAIDGKAVRAACDKVHSGRVPYLVNAFIVDAGLCIGQIRIDEKTNEIKGIPEMLEWLDLEGAVVTMDAIGCQRAITEKLSQKRADFVLPVKGNQPDLHSDIMLEMNTRIAERDFLTERLRQAAAKGKTLTVGEDPLFDEYVHLNKDHSRIERRKYYVLNDSACVNTQLWPHVKSIGLVARERQVIHRDKDDEIINEEPSVEYETYIMSREMTAEEFGCYARGHWGIENSLHWVLDDFFREDRCTARKSHATENLGLLRKFVFNMMNVDGNTKGMSKKAKQVYYRNDPEAVAKLILGDIPSRY
jgi:predicted transposase YbfD/YdcC